MMMLPMSSSKNRRIQLMPAEWSIDFQGPILGHIEHPQNCFLKSVDVDYSGGKDMSFIEGFTQSVKGVDDDPDTEVNEKVEPVNAKVQHYPNGINLNLVFQEILNLDRLRYVQRVAANAMGAQQNVQQELDEFEKQVNGEVTDEIETMIADERFKTIHKAKEFMKKKKLSSDNFEIYQINMGYTGQASRNNIQYKIRARSPEGRETG